MTTATELDSLLNDPAFSSDPYPTYARLRDEAPVFWSDGQRQWLVSGLADCKAVLRDTANFSSFGWESRFLGLLPEDVQDTIPSLWAHVSNPHILIADAPVHTRLRNALRPPFLPRALEPRRERIEALVDELLDRVRDVDPIEIVSMIAHELPVNVISDMLGAPQDDRVQFHGWSTMVTGFFGHSSPDPEEARRVDAGLNEFRAYLDRLIASRRDDPQGDLATTFADSTWDDEMDSARLGTATLLVMAGHETTRNLIATSVWALLTHKEQLDKALASPMAMDRAIEEALRWDPPVQRVRRVVRQDCEFRGVKMRAGDRLAVLLGSANRDPELCEQPDRFDIERPATTDISFGSGIHFCLGNSLALLETGIAVPALFQRFPQADLADGWTPSWRPMNTQRGLLEVKVRPHGSGVHDDASPVLESRSR
jgi:cytochrome P450